VQSQIKGHYCTFQNNPAAELITAILPAVYMIILTVFVFISIFVDAIIFTKERGCRPRIYFSEDDPFGFRFQFYITSVVLFAGTIGAVSKPLSYFTKAPNSNEHNWYPYYLDFLNIIFPIIYTLCFGCFGVIIVCIQKIQKRKRSKVYESVFDALINDKKGKEIFKRYSKSEWSMENILFFEDVEKYKECPTFKLAKRRSAEISKNYLIPGSPLEVNISGDIRKTLLKKLNNIDAHEPEYLTIFDKSIEEVRRNMRDTFSRIPRTELNEWAKNSKIKIEIETK
jgi:hypothetical protein